MGYVMKSHLYDKYLLLPLLILVFLMNKVLVRPRGKVLMQPFLYKSKIHGTAPLMINNAI